MLEGNYNEAITVFHLFGRRGTWSRRAFFQTLLAGFLRKLRKGDGAAPTGSR